MPVDKDEILDEIRRCAAENGGVPIGRERFVAETGIKPSHWNGIHWLTWTEAVREAGFEPNAMNERKLDDDEMLSHLALLTRRLGRYPTSAEMVRECRTDSMFPSVKTVRIRIGGKQEVISRLREFAKSHDDFDDVQDILSAHTDDEKPEDLDEPVAAPANGTVYLIKSGRYHKIGRTNAVGRRSYEIALQLPERSVVVHSFETDDPAGIERYWHDRFKDRRRNGEWFLLSSADVAAFKRRRRFM
ncbi:GIY-YIG nuclease family protein [Mycobacterium timonense]|uniref:Bacteriophage T5 Orf172 DNA-binding domain-containing protein n=1 Tax=Mycobacterium timonense TaxID=701043 RepID=A0ABX3TNR5_9MYCO|nr:GIY-YIG nuclease family protein [Mycobacterium timonense]ETB34899.1 hypothetical protein N602_27905 [Mycobacterium avium subsp. hominissuis 10-5606]ORB80469.1 hypothetical protein BST46_08655 [Mycobacterium timonense]